MTSRILNRFNIKTDILLRSIATDKLSCDIHPRKMIKMVRRVSRDHIIIKYNAYINIMYQIHCYMIQVQCVHVSDTVISESFSSEYFTLNNVLSSKFRFTYDTLLYVMRYHCYMHAMEFTVEYFVDKIYLYSTWPLERH